jgi:hypothetical protein
MRQLTGKDGGRGWNCLELGVYRLVVEEKSAVVGGERDVQELCMPETRSAEERGDTALHNNTYQLVVALDNPGHVGCVALDIWAVVACNNCEVRRVSGDGDDVLDRLCASVVAKGIVVGRRAAVSLTKVESKATINSSSGKRRQKQRNERQARRTHRGRWGVLRISAWQPDH